MLKETIETYAIIGCIAFAILAYTYDGCSRQWEEAFWGGVVWPFVAYEKLYHSYEHPCERED